MCDLVTGDCAVMTAPTPDMLSSWHGPKRENAWMKWWLLA